MGRKKEEERPQEKWTHVKENFRVDLCSEHLGKSAQHGCRGGFTGGEIRNLAFLF